MIQAIIIQNSTIQACLSSQVSGYGIQPPIETQNTSNDSLYLAQRSLSTTYLRLSMASDQYVR